MAEQARSRALDSWNYAAPFARYHIHWHEGDAPPAFEQGQAVAIAQQDLALTGALDLLAQRAVLVTFSSEHLSVSGRPAERVPAWVVILAGIKCAGAPADGPLASIAPGGGVVIQCLIHAHTGELLLGTAIPVTLRVGA